LILQLHARVESSKLPGMSAPRALRPVRVVFLAILLTVIAGCGGTSGSGATSQSPSAAPTPAPLTGSASPDESAAATATASAEASPSDGRSAGNGTLCTTGGSAATGTKLAIAGPDVAMRLPGGWEEMPIEQYGQLLAQAAAALNDPRITKMTEWQAGLISNGVMRAAASGTSEPSGANASLVISVLPVTVDLRTTVDFRLNDEAMNGVPAEVLELGETDLPIGPAYCAGLVNDIDIGVPSQAIEYIAMEPGGKVISLAGTAPTTDTGFPGIIRSIALTLAAD
jgi:hypothetical protein